MLGIRQIFRQTSDLVKNASAAFTTIPAMTFPMPANSKFIVKFSCRCVTGATPGQKTQLTGIDAGPHTTVRVLTNTAVLQNADAISYDGGAVALTGTIEYFGLVENLTAAAT